MKTYSRADLQAAFEAGAEYAEDGYWGGKSPVDFDEWIVKHDPSLVKPFRVSLLWSKQIDETTTFSEGPVAQLGIPRRPKVGESTEVLVDGLPVPGASAEIIYSDHVTGAVGFKVVVPHGPAVLFARPNSFSAFEVSHLGGPKWA